MKKSTLFAALSGLSFLFISTAFAQVCVDGFSGPYPCDKVHQYAEITNAEFGIELPNEQAANDIWGWSSPYTGREYATVGLFNRTAFVDISTPEHPIYLGYLPTATIGSTWRDIKVIGHWAYIVSEASEHGMQVFDLRHLESLSYSDIPVQFIPDAQYNGFGNAHNIVADTASKFVYGVGTNTFAGGLHIVDVSNPLNPTYAGSSEEDGYTHDAQVVVYHGPDAAYQGKQICFASNENTITIFDVTNKTDVGLISTAEYNLTGYTHQCWLTEDHRFLIANDELDEMFFNINTRTLIFNVEDLDNPFLIGEADLGTTSIDHNSYTHEGLVYMSNYTSGLRILSLKDVAQGELIPVGHFDVFPNGQPRIFHGSWSNYPYFESGTVVATSIYHGLHILEPRLWELDREIIEVCGSNTAVLFFDLNIPVAGTVTYSVQYYNGSGPNVVLESTSSNGAPFQNAAVFAGLNALAPGYYPGEVLINYEGFERRLPFVLAKQGSESVPAPVLQWPASGEVTTSQHVTFFWDDAFPGYVELEVASDASFDNIIYSEQIYGNATTHMAQMPFDETYYYWRLIKPNPCGEPTVSAAGEFEISQIALSTETRTKEQGLHIFPNPASTYVKIKSHDAIQQLEVYDISGRVITLWEMKAGSREATFDVSAFAPGIYFIRDVSGGGAPGKFVVR